MDLIGRLIVLIAGGLFSAGQMIRIYEAETRWGVAVHTLGLVAMIALTVVVVIG